MTQLALFPEPVAPPRTHDPNARYSLGQWWLDHDRYWPLKINGRRTINLTLWELRAALRTFRGRPTRRDNEDKFGWRRSLRETERWGDKTHEGDRYVFAERTDGKSAREIVEGWRR